MDIVEVVYMCFAALCGAVLGFMAGYKAGVSDGKNYVSTSSKDNKIK